jgi:hypothetical protein
LVIFKGFFHAILTIFSGKGTGYVSWHATEGDYWPFTTREEAFAYLDDEFRSPLSGDTPFGYTNLQDPVSLISRKLSQHVLDEYVNERRQKYLAARKLTPIKPRPTALRNRLRCFHNPNCGSDIVSFTAEHYGISIPFGYVNSDHEQIWFNLVIGVGNLGPELWKRVRYHQTEVIGVAIGMIEETSYMVLLEPGGRVFIVFDFDDETGEHDAIPYYVASVFGNVGDIGMEFEYDYFIEDEDYVLEDWHADP